MYSRTAWNESLDRQNISILNTSRTTFTSSALVGRTNCIQYDGGNSFSAERLTILQYSTEWNALSTSQNTDVRWILWVDGLWLTRRYKYELKLVLLHLNIQLQTRYESIWQLTHIYWNMSCPGLSLQYFVPMLRTKFVGRGSQHRNFVMLLLVSEGAAANRHKLILMFIEPTVVYTNSEGSVSQHKHSRKFMCTKGVHIPIDI